MPLREIDRHRWHTTGTKPQRIPTILDEWAASQEAGSIVPAEDVIISWHPKVHGQKGELSVTTRDVVRRAIALLEVRAVLHRDQINGHYYVSARRAEIQVN